MLGEKRKALSYYDQALSITREVGDRQVEAHTLSNIGVTYSSLGEQQKALAHLNQALRLSQDVGDRRGEIDRLGNIAKAHRDLGNLTEARTHIESGIKIIESLRTSVVSQEMRASFFALAQDYYEFYIDLLMRLHKQSPSRGFDSLALQANERARARSLLELLNESRADIRRGIEPTLIERERVLQQQLNARAEVQTKLLLGVRNEEQIAAIKREIETLAAQYQQVQTEIRQRSPRYASLTQPQPLTPVEIQKQILDSETLLLEYSLGNERSYLWALTSTAITSYELPKRAEIEAAAKRVYEQLSDSALVRGQTIKPRDSSLKETSEAYLAAANSLSQMLLGPVAGQLGKKRLVIVADGMLQYIPFGALPYPTISGEAKAAIGAGQWKLMLPTSKSAIDRTGAPNETSSLFSPLILKHEIVSLPSASTLSILRRELAGRKLAIKALAVLADPVFEKNDERVKARLNKAVANTDESAMGFANERIFKKLSQETNRSRIERLPFTRQEAERILALVPASEGMKALDFGANRALLESERLSQYRIVHFATHGLADSERPELSTILLSLVNEQGNSQDGFLRQHDVYNLNLPAELIVLSACQTGLGKQIKGEGLVSLTRGFMYAGAARVVVSLWSVNDQATAELMEKFYRKMLVEGERPAAALRAAQIEMWRDKRWGAPYYWAAFTLQGEWR